jgi:hypothetical protein
MTLQYNVTRMSKPIEKNAIKITKSFRLDPAIVAAVQEIAREQNQKETWVVETILGVATGLRKLPKPLKLPVSAKQAA